MKLDFASALDLESMGGVTTVGSSPSSMYDGPNGEPGYCKRSNGCMFPKTCASKGSCQASKE